MTETTAPSGEGGQHYTSVLEVKDMMYADTGAYECVYNANGTTVGSKVYVYVWGESGEFFA